MCNYTNCTVTGLQYRFCKYLDFIALLALITGGEGKRMLVILYLCEICEEKSLSVHYEEDFNVFFLFFYTKKSTDETI